MKLMASNHHLYILKDALANGGKGAVVGLIKVGHKRLFLVDIYSQQLEVNPLCVLDFYVHEQRQRSGCGLQLFKAMIEKEDVRPQSLAFDRPSNKFLNFLKKHCGLQNVVNQMNNYVVYDVFFRDLPAVGYVPKNRRFISSAPVETRQQPSVQEKRNIFSAGRSFGSTSCLSADYRTAQPAGQLDRMRHEIPSSRHNLPPRPSGRQSKNAKDRSWNLRNASNVTFGNSEPTSRDMDASPGITSRDVGSIYSRHSYLNDRSPSHGAMLNASPVTQPKKGLQNFTRIPQDILPMINNNPSPQTGPYKHQIPEQKAPTAVYNNSAGLQSTQNDRMNTPYATESYSLNNTYKQTTSLGSSAQGTSWNLFGGSSTPLNVNRSSARTRRTFFPS